MTPLDMANLIKDYGAVAGCVVLMYVVARLYNDNQRLSSGSLEKLIGQLEANKSATDRMFDALRELRGVLEARGHTVGDLDNRITLLIEKVQHGFGNTAASMEGFIRLFERERLRRGEERTADRDERAADRDTWGRP